MPSESREPLEKVLSMYNIKVLGIRNESYKDKKGVWWIQTPEGHKILKKVSSSEDTLKYTLSAVEHLMHNGINIPAVIKTVDARPYVNIDGSCYTLSQAIEGRNPSYSIPQQLKAVVKELAKFHKASIGFSPPSCCKPKMHLGTWIEDYGRQLEDMGSFYKTKLLSGPRDESGSFIADEFPSFSFRAERSINGLKGSEYRDWTEKTRSLGGLCHQDFAAGNLFLSGSGKVYVIDTDSITMDIPARDIRKLLNKVMKKKGKWDASLTADILRYYQSENPLTLSQWQVVKLDIMFPHLFLGAMNKYCYKREKDWTGENYLKRLRDVTSIEKTINPILEGFDSLVPKSSL
ncbi:spore coat-associated protein S [Anaerobacterium chartisolvens]|uniref:Spore coat-associated protein S n=1 Tax=Anaerobacterium chartisolvens TaxID=1297424 RepID=A0A369AW03_9FIRM|nr:CotS family spore coat protein [Anaerobacterium chartisolvens]RCX12528.1 spore coat-associated protein S [Anaerobacterium chartisolvens]